MNETVRQNPDSSIAQLMGKFEQKYLAEDGTMGANPAEAVYERSLSSLLFLSMGIFLLNSVNELVQSGSLPQGEARYLMTIVILHDVNLYICRSMPTDLALENLVKDSSRHQEVFQLFNSTAFDFFDHEDGQNLLGKLKPSNTASTVNSYVRLVMNLINAYIRSESSCIPVLLYPCTPVLLYSCAPVLMYSCTHVLLYSGAPVLLYSCTPVLLYSCAPVLPYSCALDYLNQ